MKPNDHGLVSCVLPTRDRPVWLAQAVRYWLRQTHTPRELVLVAHGQQPVPDAVTAHPYVRVIRADPQATLGAVRNAGVEAARGDVIACWDDDDWYGPQRLRQQLSALDDGADVTGASEYLAYLLLEGRARRYRPADQDPAFLAGATLMFRRQLWEQAPFPDMDVGEDAAFVARLHDAVVRPVTDPPWFVALHHPGNTATKNMADPRWHDASLDDVARRIGDDRVFYHRLRTGNADEATANPSPHAVTVAGDLLVYDGLGSMTEYAALGMDRVGCDVRLAPIACDEEGLARRTRELLRRPTGEGPVLYWSWPRAELAQYASRPDLFVRTAWESSELPASWLPPLAAARAVVVPSRSVADACRAAGLTGPVEVVPDGVDPAVHRLQQRPEREGVTTLVVGTLIPRKHVDAAVEAWRLAFDDDPTARLVVKARFRAGTLDDGDPRIQVIDTEEPVRGLARYYQQADVLLALGNEGFGLPLVEGMATGLPVVAMDSEGQADVCREAQDLVLAVPPARLAPYDDPRYGVCGVAAVPDVPAVADRLRWVASHPDEARDLGAAAAHWVARHRNVWAMGPAVLSVMEQHTGALRRTRHDRTVWVPSWNRRCGVSEYTRHLVHGMRRAVSGPGVRQCTVTARPVDLAGARLLHVQHEDALFDDAELAALLDSVDVPVVVTEHSVRPGRRAWEDHADRLVALTSAGAEVLRGRCGNKVVEVEHGCPTWFPPRKRTRGRVLGTFGFPASYKRLDLVLDALRRLPDVELVLYGHPRTVADARTVERAIDGLPVRWHRQWLPSGEVARRLAAECDVLVFWHDDVGHVSASGAARVGLATGVPVITRRTPWFADLAGVTHQPDDLADGVRRVLDDTELRRELGEAARDHCSAHSWRRVAATHLSLWQSLESA